MNRTLSIMIVLTGFMAGCRGDGYPDEVVEDLKNSCEELGALNAECDCQVAKIRRMVPYEEYKQRKARGEGLPIEVEVEAARCVDQHHYPSRIVDAFIVGCIKDGGSFDQCACIIRRRQKIQPYADFVRDGLEGRPTPREVVEDGIVCIK